MDEVIGISNLHFIVYSIISINHVNYTSFFDANTWRSWHQLFHRIKQRFKEHLKSIELKLTHTNRLSPLMPLKLNICTLPSQRSSSVISRHFAPTSRAISCVDGSAAIASARRPSMSNLLFLT